jgi:membrane fusion protein, hemolysin D
MSAMQADAKVPIEDPGLYTLILLLRLIGAGAESEQLHRNVASPVGVKEMIRLAKTAGLAARSSKLPWTKLAGGPLPAIAVLRKGRFLLLGKVTGNTAIVLAPDAERPTLMTREQFEAVWDGRLVFVKQRGAPATQVEQSRESAVGQLQQLWKTSLARANGISRIIKPGAEKETPSSPATASAGIIILADHARKLGRAVARIRPDEERRRHDELAFLPAALEIVETPPSPLGRATAFSIAAVFAVAVAWACLGTVDIVATAPGKLIPSGRTKTIQPFETGVVRSIKVHDGQAVKSGDVLIELDTTITAAELSRLKGDLLSAQLDIARTKAALARNEDPISAFKPPADATPTQIEMHRRFLVSQGAEQNAKLAAIDQQVKQKEAERATFEASIEKIKATLAPLQQRVEIRQQLFQKELGSKLTYLTEYQEYVGQQQEISVMQRRQRG